MKGLMINPGSESVWQTVAAAALILALVLLLTGCSNGTRLFDHIAGKPAEPLEVTRFSYSHSGMSLDDCYSATFEAAPGGGTHVVIELGYGDHTADEVLQEDYMAWLSELATQYRMDKWDGFDKVNKRVLDGEGFSLNMELADGRTVSARGSSAWPKDFGTAMQEVETLIDSLAGAYSDLYPKEIVSDEIDYFLIQFRSDADSIKEFRLICSGTDDGLCDLEYTVKNREDLMESVQFDGTCTAFPFDRVQELIRKHGVPAWNGWRLTDAAGENFNVEVHYGSGESIEAYGRVHPEGYDAFREEITALLKDFIIENRNTFTPYSTD